MTVSGRSDFPAYHNLPEVYHGHGISKAVFSAPEDRVTGQRRDTTYSVMVSWNTATSCVAWPLRAGGAEADPELTEIGSEVERRRICAENAILMIYFEPNRIIA